MRGMMKLFLVAVTLSALFFIIGCATQERAGRAPVRMLEDVTPDEAYTIIKKNGNNPDFMLLDVRTEDEYRSGHLVDAVNIDFYSENFREKLDALDREDTYVIYCKSGGRSGQTLKMMEELGFRRVYNIIGGIQNWQRNNLPVVR